MTDRDASLTRLNKFISETGFCSRREADRYIAEGRVTINGVVPEMGTKVAPGDEVLVNGKPLKAKQEAVYLAFNKPVGITCTTERHVDGNIIDYIGHPKRIFPIGRLDKPSDGLIFLTSDGDIVNKILRAGNAHEKEYVVRVDKPINGDFLKRMAAGVPILDTITQPCRIEQISTYVFRIILTQGLNRQIRRMCEALGYEVFKLKRVRIMNVSLDGLGVGEWRYLTQREMADIQQMIEGSSGTEEASRLAAAPPPSQHATAARHQRAARDTDVGRRNGTRRHVGGKSGSGQRSSDKRDTGQRGAGQRHPGQRSGVQQAGTKQEGTGRRERSDERTPGRGNQEGRSDGRSARRNTTKSSGGAGKLAGGLKPRTRGNASDGRNERGAANSKGSVNKTSANKGSANSKTAANKGGSSKSYGNTSSGKNSPAGKGDSYKGGGSSNGGRGRR
ncbi:MULTISPECIES: 23S rRNA pseudouridine(2604) synthase RluF [unclassified Cobetia]|uniref:23S rRNA pseudouridine(2604) synthase RluF n=1 Tax=unclassified Cobetia TaxID=2609414 RepID=UPI002096EE95|nr:MULTISPECIES: 23S rRNA pseudouridine(2604) synthase RluF [unclassified Cobetia]MCO7232938.1 23S rRNA pseudouridine(2604) synthase RluF [Cobetia sp. Dlab-2-AX]MCO7236074.1 23S rRNA pseudouridine(2604) synthase RluF [Cobetia sp. Dlab-2-U]